MLIFDEEPVLVKLLAYFLINTGTSGFTSNTLLIRSTISFYIHYRFVLINNLYVQNIIRLNCFDCAFFIWTLTISYIYVSSFSSISYYSNSEIDLKNFIVQQNKHFNKRFTLPSSSNFLWEQAWSGKQQKDLV